MLCRQHLLIAMVVASLVPDAARGNTVQDVVDRVSQDQYTHFLGDDNFLYTHLGNSRAAGSLSYPSQHDSAKANIFSTFDGFGLNTVIESGTYYTSAYGNVAYSNVVATLPGTVHPNQVFIVSGHYDSRAIASPCPGADDDASGVAGVLEIARVLSQYQFDATIKFIAFDREENAISGSSGYVAAYSTEDVRGMISMDAIAFNYVDPAHHDKAWVYYYNSPASRAVSQDLANALSTYTDITPTVAQMGYSDHVSFDSKGSALLIEHAMENGHFDNNPYFHTANDAIESTYQYPKGTGPFYNYIDYAYATDMTRGVVGYLATKAQLVAPEPGTVVLLIIAAFVCLPLKVRPNTRG